MQTNLSAPSGVRVLSPCSWTVPDAAGLSGLIHAPLQMVSWARPTASEIVEFARSVLASEPFELREEIDRSFIESFDPTPQRARELDPRMAARFAEDVRELIRLFVELTSARTVGVRLLRVNRAMCPRFHSDRVPVRLLFTYCGTGTEWLADQDVDRSHLGPRSGGLDDGVTGLILPGAEVRRVPALTVALLKGSAWPGNEDKGAVHRSPPVRAGERRVLLSLDVLE